MPGGCGTGLATRATRPPRRSTRHTQGSAVVAPGPERRRQSRVRLTSLPSGFSSFTCRILLLAFSYGTYELGYQFGSRIGFVSKPLARGSCNVVLLLHSFYCCFARCWMLPPPLLLLSHLVALLSSAALLSFRCFPMLRRPRGSPLSLCSLSLCCATRCLSVAFSCFLVVLAWEILFTGPIGERCSTGGEAATCGLRFLVLRV